MTESMHELPQENSGSLNRTIEDQLPAQEFKQLKGMDLVKSRLASIFKQQEMVYVKTSEGKKSYVDITTLEKKYGVPPEKIRSFVGKFKAANWDRLQENLQLEKEFAQNKAGYQPKIDALKQMKLGLNDKQIQRIVVFAEHIKRNAPPLNEGEVLFIRKSTKRIPRSLEIHSDGEIHIHLRNKIGQGGFKVVRKSLLYDGTNSKVMVRGGGKLKPGLSLLNLATEKRILLEPKFKEVKELATAHRVNLFEKVKGKSKTVKVGILQELYAGNLEKKIGSLSKKEQLAVAKDIAFGVKILHAEGIVHSDLKPENILLHKEGGAAVADFGLAWYKRGGPENTSKHFVNGTISFMPPEVFARNEYGQLSELGTSLDIWSMGAIMYCMIKKKSEPPVRDFNGNYDIAYASTISADLRKEAEKTKDPLDKKTLQLIADMMDPKPWNRPSAEAVHKRLTQLHEEA